MATQSTEIETMRWHPTDGGYAHCITNSPSPKVLLFPGMGEGREIVEANLMYYAAFDLPVAAIELNYSGTSESDIDATLTEGPRDVLDMLGSALHVVGNSKGSGEAAEAGRLAIVNNRYLFRSFGFLGLPGLSYNYSELKTPEERRRLFAANFRLNKRQQPWATHFPMSRLAGTDDMRGDLERIDRTLRSDAIPYLNLLATAGHPVVLGCNRHDLIFPNTKNFELKPLIGAGKLIVNNFAGNHDRLWTRLSMAHMRKIIEQVMASEVAA